MSFFAIALFFVWTGLTTIFAYDPEFSYPYWLEFAKTLALLYLVATIIINRTRVHALMLVIYISMAYWGAKGGVFSILSGGGNVIFGPNNTHISDNNHLALALTITLPIGYFLYRQSEHALMRMAVSGSALLTFICVFMSYSRGAFLALATMGAFWLITTRRFKVFIAAAIIGGVTFTLLPDEWFDRMETIGEYEEDRSALGRFDAWKTSFNIARADPMTGAGFTAVEIPSVYFSHNPESILGRSKAAHSIYFQVMGDHGFAGLFLYLLLGFMAWRNLQIFQSTMKLTPQDQWLLDLASSLRISLVGFWVGGAFLSMAYYDVYFMFVILTGTLRLINSEISPTPSKLAHVWPNAGGNKTSIT